jgi:hypothetical protein
MERTRALAAHAASTDLAAMIHSSRKQRWLDAHDQRSGNLDSSFESGLNYRLNCAAPTNPRPSIFRPVKDMKEQMNSDGRGHLLWPSIFAAAFFLIPVGLLFAHPISFWCSTDNEPMGLANALNMAYRLADFRLYSAEGMTYHPGVQFHFMSWLALAVTGYPVAGAGQDFFRAVIDHVDDYYRASIYVAALVGATGVYVFARSAMKLIPVGAIAVGLLLWLLSTPATILFFMSPGYESVAILANSLFLLVLVRLAFDRDIDPTIIVLAGCVGAFAYLNKLSYIYIPLALVSAIFCKAVFLRVGWLRGASFVAVFLCTAVGVVVATGYLIIGGQTFHDLLRFHQGVIMGSGMYGTGARNVVDKAEVWHAIMAIPRDKTYAMAFALIGGALLFIAGMVTGIKNREKDGVAVIGIGAGLAGLLSSLIVLKHYDSHYTAGVSATLPACAVAACLFAEAWNFKARIAAFALACVAVLLMADPVLASVRHVLASRSNSTQLALADRNEIAALTAAMTRVVDFAYRVPFPQYGEGMVVHYAGVPRLFQTYLQNKGPVTNSVTEQSVTEDVGAYVIDKGYFPTVEAVKGAANVDLTGPRPIQFQDGDELIELRTVFLLIRK